LLVSKWGRTELALGAMSTGDGPARMLPRMRGGGGVPMAFGNLTYN
jgi:hypothetical protein